MNSIDKNRRLQVGDVVIMFGRHSHQRASSIVGGRRTIGKVYKNGNVVLVPTALDVELKRENQQWTPSTFANDRGVISAWETGTSGFYRSHIELYVPEVHDAEVYEANVRRDTRAKVAKIEKYLAGRRNGHGDYCFGEDDADVVFALNQVVMAIDVKDAAARAEKEAAEADRFQS